METYLDYARRGQNAWWRYLLVAFLAMVLVFFGDTVIGIVLVLSRILPREVLAEVAAPSHPLVFLIGNGLVFVTVIAAFALMMRALQGKRFGDVIGAWNPRFFAIGFGLWSVCLVVASLADFALQPSGFRWTASGATLVLTVVSVVMLGVQTFAEEFIFRGWLTQGLLLATRRPLPAAVLSGLMFGALHIPNGIPQAVNAVLFGVIASLIAIRTGGIAFTWGLHLINNLFGAVVIVSAADVFKGSPGLITQSTPGLIWFDVTAGVVLLTAPLWFVYRVLPAPEARPATAEVFS